MGISVWCFFYFNLIFQSASGFVEYRSIFLFSSPHWKTVHIPYGNDVRDCWCLIFQLFPGRKGVTENDSEIKICSRDLTGELRAVFLREEKYEVNCTISSAVGIKCSFISHWNVQGWAAIMTCEDTARKVRSSRDGGEMLKLKHSFVHFTNQYF